MNRERTGTAGKVRKSLDLNEETRLDWACAQKFNKIIWGQWPSSMLKLYEVLEEKGYVVRHNAPITGFQNTVKKTFLDLYVAEDETVEMLYRPIGRPHDRRAAEKMLADFRLAQRSRLVCTAYLSESNGGAVGFALFRELGTQKCLVYVMHQCARKSQKEK